MANFFGFFGKKLIRGFVPIICSSVDKFCSGNYIAENRRLSSCGNTLSLCDILKLCKSPVACFARCRY